MSRKTQSNLQAGLEGEELHAGVAPLPGAPVADDRTGHAEHEIRDHLRRSGEADYHPSCDRSKDTEQQVR